MAARQSVAEALFSVLKTDSGTRRVAEPEKNKPGGEGGEEGEWAPSQHLMIITPLMISNLYSDENERILTLGT